MKKLLCAFLMVLFCTAFARAESYDLNLPDPEGGPDTTIVGYVVYFWEEANPDRKFRYVTDGTTRVPDIGDTLNLTPGNTYAFVVVPYTMPNIPIGESEPLFWQYGERPILENDLPIRIFIDKPSIISIDQQ
jgi:hypothetical protein